ncbi:hypothetical protein AB6F55_10055 [Providencia hangzhouensis]
MVTFDRIDKRKILLTAILLLSLDSLAIIFCLNFSVAGIFRVIGGMASAALVPVIFFPYSRCDKEKTKQPRWGVS